MDLLWGLGVKVKVGMDQSKLPPKGLILDQISEFLLLPASPYKEWQDLPHKNKSTFKEI